MGVICSVAREPFVNSHIQSERTSPARVSPFAQAAGFVRAHAVRIGAISAAALVPVFWHGHIEAGDLGSHVYNAWLAQLIERGQAPGLWLAHCWNNVLIDWMLTGFGSLVGLHAAERIAVSLAVLLFFWGAFALIGRAAQRAPWFMTPLLAAITYGWTFEMGFLNYYLSLAFAFWGLAIFWRGRGWQRALALLFAPAAYVAHPLGLLLLIGVAAYVWLAERLRGRGAYRAALLFAACGALVALHFYLARHFITDPPDEPYWTFSGIDQLMIYGPRYWIAAVVMATFAVVALAIDRVERWKQAGRDNLSAIGIERDDMPQGLWARFVLPIELYALLGVGVVALPDGIHLPQYPAAIALLTERLTSVSAVVICCVLGVMRPRWWHLVATSVVALAFFGLLFRDTGRVSRMETKVEQLVRTIPRDSRVMATLPAWPEARVSFQHIVDRACVGHCFSYGNYEASSQQFRVRANEGNGYVMTNDKDPAAMEEGWYEVLSRDLPAWDVYQCGLNDLDLCIRPLAEGEDVDQRGVHPAERPAIDMTGAPSPPAKNP